MTEPNSYNQQEGGGILVYSVTTTLPDPALADEYVAWLRAGHVQAVLAGGATSGSVARLEDDAQGRPRVESRYEFPSREAFEAYTREAAPALRAQGLATFPPTRGVSMERRVGVLQARWTRGVGAP